MTTHDRAEFRRQAALAAMQGLIAKHSKVYANDSLLPVGDDTVDMAAAAWEYAKALTDLAYRADGFALP